MRKNPPKFEVILLLIIILIAGCTSTRIENFMPQDTKEKDIGIGPFGPRLRNLAQQKGFLVGTGIIANFWKYETLYTETIKKEFNIITPENQMKWQQIHPSRYKYNWLQSDRQVEFAEDNNMKFHGHTLVWHNQNPSWLKPSFDKSTMIEILREHIQAVVGRYECRIALWDVVNEALDNDSLRETIWLNTIGPEYIDLSFQFAHEADASAMLIYNDYNISTLNHKSNKLYDLIQDMLHRGIPIHGVGFQMHITNSGIDYQSFERNMKRFADLGLQIYVTELDVRMTDNSKDNLNKQAYVYQNILKLCLEQPNCRAVQMWGFTDRHSWIPNFFPGYGSALPFDEHYRPKPAYYTIQNIIMGDEMP